MDFATLRASGAEPAWFGLGFIQLKIDDVSRVHVWHPDLPQDAGEEELHDHRYDFNSTVLAGSIEHEVFEFYSDPLGSHEMVMVSCEKGVEADPEPMAVGSLRRSGCYRMVAGSNYDFPSTGFHSLKATKAATLLRRGQTKTRFARVIREVGRTSTCPFANTTPAGDLWDYVEDVLAPSRDPVGYHLRSIPKGVLGEASKIVEETLEFVDAFEQGVKVMEFVELSDLYGAMGKYLAENHPGMTMNDLAAMSEVTSRAFENGRR